MINPVFALEHRRRARRGRLAALVTGELVVLAAVLALTYQAQTAGAGLTTSPATTDAAALGRSLFQWLVFALTLLLLFVVPAATAGAVAGEREQRTLVPLLLTRLAPRSILAGKLGTAAATIGVLLAAALPLLAVPTVVGGVSLARVTATTAVLAAVAVGLAGLTLACSGLARRAQTAAMLAYGAIAVLTFGTLFLAGAAAVLDRSAGEDPADPPGALLAPNPLVVVADVAADRSGGVSADTPLDGLRTLAHRSDRPGGRVVPLWLLGLAVIVTSAAIGLVVAGDRMRIPAIHPP